jgi:energy-coupling factor transporter ATP-binding protein EcfA2
MLYRAESLAIGYGGGEPAFAAPLLEIEGGSSVALLGPNGSGKTSLLKALAALLRPSAGRLLFEGEEASTSASLRRRSVYLHQQPYLLAGTVSRNLYYGGKARSLPRARIEGLMSSAVADLGLAGFERRSGRALSGGEAQRVALARALASGADVLLLDEPTASADEASAVLILRALRARHQGGVTLVFSTHDRELASSLATRIIRLEGGRVVGDGRPGS